MILLPSVIIILNSEIYRAYALYIIYGQERGREREWHDSWFNLALIESTDTIRSICSISDVLSSF